MASFEEKVEALRKLRERREAKNAVNAAVIAPTPAFSPKSRVSTAVDAAHDEEDVARLQGKLSKSVRATDPTEADQPQSAEPRDYDAFFCAGHCSEYGLHGCTKDVPVAAEMYRMAAEGGHIIAQWRYGDLLESGRDGVEQDLEAAVTWYRRAAEAGNAHAQSNLALMLEEGRGVEQDDAEAFRWHLLAADQGNALSQYCAAVCLEEGRGTIQDCERALYLMQRSAKAGFGPATAALGSVVTEPSRREFTPEPEGEPDGTSEAEPSLLGLAARIAQQLQGLNDDEAGGILDELLTEVPSLLEQDSVSNSEDEDEDEQFQTLHSPMKSSHGALDQQKIRCSS